MAQGVPLHVAQFWCFLITANRKKQHAIWPHGNMLDNPIWMLWHLLSLWWIDASVREAQKEKFRVLGLLDFHINHNVEFQYQPHSLSVWIISKTDETWASLSTRKTRRVRRETVGMLTFCSTLECWFCAGATANKLWQKIAPKKFTDHVFARASVF